MKPSLKQTLTWVVKETIDTARHLWPVVITIISIFAVIIGAFKLHMKEVTAPIVEKGDLGEIIDMIPTGPDNNRLQIRTPSGIYNTGLYYGRSVIAGSHLVYVKRASGYEEYQIESPSK